MQAVAIRMFESVFDDWIGSVCEIDRAMVQVRLNVMTTYLLGDRCRYIIDTAGGPAAMPSLVARRCIYLLTGEEAPALLRLYSLDRCWQARNEMLARKEECSDYTG